MKRIYKIIICVIAAVTLVSGCSSVSDGGSSFMEFFGFNQTTGTEKPGGNSGNDQKAENLPHSDTDPFGTGGTGGTGSSSEKQTGGGLADLDWDDFDPALIETDDSNSAPKYIGGVQDDWEVPSFGSYGDGSNSNGSDEVEEKRGGPSPYTSFPVNSPSQNHRTATPINFYHIYDNPVFRPTMMLPCTGFSTKMDTKVKTNVTYAATNMSLTIPTLNVTEEIVVVPLVDDDFPVASLGEKIGLLEGSGPGAEDLFVLVGHNHLNAEEKGPFVELSALNESDLIFVRGAKDAARTFVVYANELFEADDIEGLLSYAKPGSMILITCEDESVDGGYLNRRVIYAEAKED